LRTTDDGTVIDGQDRDRTGYANIIEEMNCHELPRNTKPCSSIDPRISEDF